VAKKTLGISKTFGIEGRGLLKPEDDYDDLREFHQDAYDAVQLAAALDTSRVVSQVDSTEITLVSGDLDLNAAAFFTSTTPSSAIVFIALQSGASSLKNSTSVSMHSRTNLHSLLCTFDASAIDFQLIKPSTSRLFCINGNCE